LEGNRSAWKVFLVYPCFFCRVFFLRLAFATALVAVAACVCFTAPSFHHHMYSWKNALAFAEKKASVRAGSVVLQQQEQRRFLAMAFIGSYGTLDWLAQAGGASHTVRELGVFDGVKVLNLCPVPWRMPGSD
jgi:hypothetical protein